MVFHPRSSSSSTLLPNFALAGRICDGDSLCVAPMEQGLEAFRKSYNIIVASWFWSLDIECLVGNGRERFVDVRR